jgi:hypothetical protein
MREPDANSLKSRAKISLFGLPVDLPRGSAFAGIARPRPIGSMHSYRFREIVLVVDDSEREAFLPLVEEVRDVRLFRRAPGTEYYRAASLLPRKLFGDVLSIANADEMPHLDTPCSAQQTEEAGTVTCPIAQARRRSRTRWMALYRAWPMARFKVDPSDFQTIAMPRTLLNTSSRMTSRA